MSVAFAFFTFLNAWWIMLFVAIPFSTEYEEITEKQAIEGYRAAPKAIYWKRAAIIATIMAALVTIIISLVIREFRN